MKVKTWYCYKHGTQYIVGLVMQQPGEEVKNYCADCIIDLLDRACTNLTPTGEMEELPTDLFDTKSKETSS